MKIAVIDDERPSRSELCHLILDALPDAQVDEADTGQKALELLAAAPYDAVFVDVHLGDITGTALSLMLRQMYPAMQIVFATAYDQYAIKAFDAGAADYITKPFDPRLVKRALQRISARLEAADTGRQAELPQMSNKLSIVCDKRVLLLDIEEIAYIETDSRSCVLHTRRGDYTTTQPLGYFEKKLTGARFFRTHKSYLVNLQYVVELYPWQSGMFCIRLTGYEQQQLPVGRKQVRLLKEIFEI